jgi:hypothetical protein
LRPRLLSKPKNPSFHGSRDCDENGQTNERRAQRAYTALLAYVGTDRLDETLETHLQDLLNDLMHLACHENIDYNDALRMALNNYKEEK